MTRFGLIVTRLVALTCLSFAGLLLIAARPALAQIDCKPAAPLPASKCNKDAQCCAGLVCGPAGPSINNATTQCQPGCRIAGIFRSPGALNPANACQSCQPAVSTTAWTNVANGTTCNDGNACTQTDTCQSGVCTGSNPVVCAASDQCHVAGTCNPATGRCSNPNAPDDTPCNDGDACMKNDICTNGKCGGTAYTCAAPDQCHQPGTCNGDGTCSYATKIAGTTCVNDCVSGTATCNSSGQCTGSTNVADGTPCNGGNLCMTGGTCSSGTCTGATPTICPGQDACHNAATCDPTTGTCPAPTQISDGQPCNNHDCQVGGTCTGGVCSGATAAPGNRSVLCRPDVFAADGTTCDVPEYCDGSNLTCPADGYAPQGTLCRGIATDPGKFSFNICDQVEYCTGASNACPPDIGLPLGTACGGVGCTSAGECQGRCGGLTGLHTFACSNNADCTGKECPAYYANWEACTSTSIHECLQATTSGPTINQYTCGGINQGIVGVYAPTHCYNATTNSPDSTKCANASCPPPPQPPCDSTSISQCLPSTLAHGLLKCSGGISLANGAPCTDSNNDAGTCADGICQTTFCSRDIMCPDGYVCDSNHGCVRAPTGAFGASCTGNSTTVSGDCGEDGAGVRFACCAEMQGTGQGYAAGNGQPGRCVNCCNTDIGQSTAVNCGGDSSGRSQCCDGRCVDTFTDGANCGGCGYTPPSLGGGTNCNDLRNACSPSMSCTENGDHGDCVPSNPCGSGNICTIPTVPVPNSCRQCSGALVASLYPSMLGSICSTDADCLPFLVGDATLTGSCNFFLSTCDANSTRPGLGCTSDSDCQDANHSLGACSINFTCLTTGGITDAIAPECTTPPYTSCGLICTPGPKGNLGNPCTADSDCQSGPSGSSEEKCLMASCPLSPGAGGTATSAWAAGARCLFGATYTCQVPECTFPSFSFCTR